MDEKKVRPELNRLFREIEQGWRDSRDRMVVYRLAEKHPELREELYGFFEDLVLGGTADFSSDVAAAEDRVAHWIQSAGRDIAASAARRERTLKGTTTPTQQRPVDVVVCPERPSDVESETWVAFLRRRVRQRLADVANALPNVSVEYLVLVSRHPDKVPSQVCHVLATLVEQRWNVPVDESLECLSTRQVVVRAASRSQVFSAEPATFEDLLSRAALSPEQRDFWMRHAHPK